MVVPDTHDGPRSKRMGKSAILLLAGVALGVGLLLGQLTTPSPIVAVQTTTTVLQTPSTTPVIAVQGFQPAWTLARWLETGEELVAIHRIESRTLLFVKDRSLGLTVTEYLGPPGAGGLIPAGAIPELTHVGAVVQSRFGIHIFGYDREGLPTVWRSVDGLTWNGTILATPEGITGLFLHQAHGSDDLLIAVASTDIYPFGQILAARAAVYEQYGELVEDLEWYEEDDRVRFVLYGPLHLVVDTVDAEDLGLDPDRFRTEPTSGDRLVIWVSDDGSNWRLARETGIQWLGGMFTGPDGRIWVNGYDRGNDLLATSDGETWVRVGRAGSVYQIRQWREGYLARRLEGPLGQILGLVSSENGEEWIDLHLETYVSDEEQWALAFGNSDAGIGAIAQRWSFPVFSDEPPRITRSGLNLVVRPDAVEVEEDGWVVARVERSSPQDSSLVDFNLSTGTVKFLGSAPGASTIATFSLLDLTALARLEAQHLPMPLVSGHAFFFSADGEAWIVQDIGGLSDGLPIQSVYVIEDTVFLVTGPSWTSNSKVWVTTLPDSVTGMDP